MNKTVCVTTSDFCFIAKNINISGLSMPSLPAFHSSISSGQVSAFEAFSLLPFDPHIISSLLIVFSLFLSNDHLKMLALQLNFPVRVGQFYINLGSLCPVSGCEFQPKKDRYLTMCDYTIFHVKLFNFG